MKIIKNIMLSTLLIFPLSILAHDDIEATKICPQVANIPFPTTDQVNINHLVLDPKCHALDYYYGINCRVDVEKARLRAYEEMQKNENNDGSIVLTMLYANGEGVAMNIKIAEKLACKNYFAEGELYARIFHLAQLSTDTLAKKFDFCDDITSGNMMGYCANITKKITAAKRDADLQRIIKSWMPKQKLAFTNLQKAADEFAKERSTEEVDLSGTARSMYIIQEEATQNEDFIQSIEMLEKHKAPSYSTAQLHEEDKKLNSLYQSLRNMKYNSFTTITASGIQHTQRAWVKYRDAWVAFAKMRYPQYSSDSIAAWFTKKRNHMLNSLSRSLR